jgi:hypothetical protein
LNAVEIEEAISELAGQPFDPAEFPYAFLEAFGNKATTIKRLRTGNNNKSDIEGGVLQRNNIHIAVCDEGAVADTLTQLRESPATTKAKAKFILATDGKEFQAEDVNSGETVACDYPDFHDHFGFFLPLAGISTVKQIRESAFDIKATGRLNKLYIELLRHNPDWASAERRHDMNHFLARLTFCFFAEDTDIFHGDNLFTATVQQMSASDASDTHEVIGELFRAMDTKTVERQEKNIKNWANGFPYVNGELFSGSTETPKFTKIARSYLLHVGNLDWKQINPDIFGSMIQAVADEEERGALGMHYTSVPNILKVLNPLFLDDLRAALEDAGDNARKLLNLRKRIARIRVFDPACGSGNFLVIAYKQMREIEAEINRRRDEIDRASEIPLTNFRGIELRDFSCEIARLALIIAEYQCDVLYRGQKLALAEFLPLNKENWITCGNALRLDWLSICPPTGTGVKMHGDDLFATPLDQSEIDFENEGGETYICGNPPFAGQKKKTKGQRDDMDLVMPKYYTKYGELDYVTAFFVKAAEFCRSTESAAALVSTNSIVQGRHIPTLWPPIFKMGCEIVFGHRSFLWKNNAARNASVYCVIVGISASWARKYYIYEGDSKKEACSISAYLTDGLTNTVTKRKTPLSKDLQLMRSGNMPLDNGNLLLDTDAARKIINDYPEAQKFILKIVGAKEINQNLQRYCIWIEDTDYEEALKIEPIRDRIDACRKYRTSSSAPKLAETPHAFRDRHRETFHTIILPNLSSERRNYRVPILAKRGVVASNLALSIYDGDIFQISILCSRIHHLWVEAVCGKLKQDFRYSNDLGWHTFPLPKLTEKQRNDLETCATEILLAQEHHFPKNLNELYNFSEDEEERMPEDLRRAHDRNDEVLERIYIGRRFKNDTERLEKLFDLYTQMTIKGKAA